MAPRKQKQAVQAPPEETGPVRYTQERLFYGCDSDLTKALKQVWKDGEQLATETIPDEGLCVVTMMAAWGRRFGVDVVDDYELLLQRCRDAMAEMRIHHPELFFVSCICILFQRNEEPTIGGFEQVGVPDHFANLIGGDE